MKPTDTSVRALRSAIARLPEDKRKVTPGKWYLSQKEHWLGWLREYHGPGAYGRTTESVRTAQFAYNHIIEVKMLLWLIEAAGIPAAKVRRARRAAAGADSLAAKSGAVRRVVPWAEMAEALFPGRR